jgi:hypothetical protein
MRFFEHNYQANDEETRVDRLEKLVFGESKDGDLDKRIAALKNATDNAVDSAAEQPSAADSGNSSGFTATPAARVTDNSPPDSSVHYPKIDELESLVFNEEFPKLKLPVRIGQLENKVFGKISSSTDLSQRTETLELYWQNSLQASVHKQYNDTVSWLESQVMGETYPERPLIERIQTLEGIIFPQEAVETRTNIGDLIHTMANAINLHKNSGAQNNNIVALNHNRDSGIAANYNYSSSRLAADSAGPVTSSSQQYHGNALYQHTNYPLNATGNQYQNAYQQPAQSPAQQYAQHYALSPSGAYGQAQTGYYNNAITSSGNSNIGYQPGYSTPSGYLAGNNQQAQEAAQPKGHPLLKGLAKALGAAASMAAGAMMSSSMYNGGYGGNMPGYMPGYPGGGSVFNYP